MSINIDAIVYDPLLVLSNGDVLPLARVTQGLQWEEQPGELAQRLSLVCHNAPTSFGRLHQVMALASKIVLRCDWGIGPQLLFIGTVEEWEFTDDGQEVISVTAYDDLRGLAASEDEYLFPEDSSAPAALKKILSDWGLTLGRFEMPEVSLPKMRLDGSLADSIFTILTEVFYRLDEQAEYFVRMRVNDGSNVIDVVKPASNEPWHITEELVARYRDHQSLRDYISQVHLLGSVAQDKGAGIPATSEDAANAAVRPRIDELMTHANAAVYGRRRALVRGQENDTVEELKKRGTYLLSEHAEPSRDRTILLPDIPPLRKGDALRLNVGTASGVELIVTSVQHDADARTMEVTFDSSGTFEHREHRGETDDTESSKSWVPTETEGGSGPVYGGAGTGAGAKTTAASAPAGGGQFRTDDPRLLTDDAIAKLSLDAGVPKERVAVAVAVCIAESTGWPQNTHTNSGGGAGAGSVDRGLWQINSYWHPEVSEQCAFDPACNARAMARISNKGATWSAWAAYNNGSYQKFMDRGRAAAVKL